MSNFGDNAPNRSDKRRAVVIGAGFGGLATAVRLQAAGMQVTVLEKREQVGGRAYQLQDSGYVFDMGPSLVTAPYIIDSVFRSAGRSLGDYVDLVPLDPFYRVFFHDRSSIDYVGEPSRMKEQMRRFNAGDADRFDDFMAAIQPIHEAVIDDRLGGRPFDSLGKMLSFLPRMARLGGHKSVTRFVNRFFEDPRHRFLYSFHPLFVGGNPFSTPAIYLMIPYLERAGGVWFAQGGMYSIVEAMASVFRELGGRILTGHEVSSVEVRSGAATGVYANGYHPADLVVSNADVGHLYGDLVPVGARSRWTDKRVGRLDHSMSCFVMYLGTRRQYPELAHHTLILSERYEGLLKDIFKHKVLPPDFSMYLHVPTRTDPGMAPPGCESMYVLIPVANNESGIDWTQAGPVLEQRVVQFLEAWGLDGLSESIDVSHTFTPDDFAGELNAVHGNAFGVVPKLTQTAWLRPHNRSEDVNRLYLAGAGTHPGAGVPGVLLSAEAAYHSIAEDFDLPPAWDHDQPGQVAWSKMPTSEELSAGTPA